MSAFKQLLVLAGEGNFPLANGVLSQLSDMGIEHFKSHIDCGNFADQEPNDKIVLSDQVSGSDVLIFQSMKTLELEAQFMDLAGACMHQYGARSVTAVLPFMRFRRQDNPNKEKNEINRNLLLIKRMAAMGISRAVFCDIHSQVTLDNCQQEGIKAWNVDPAPAFVPFFTGHIAEARETDQPIFVLALDRGSIPRAIRTARALDLPVSVCFKRRLSPTRTIIIKNPQLIAQLKQEHGADFIFDDSVLNGALVIMPEDELSTGGSARDMGDKLIEELGASKLVYSFSHAVCTGDWRDKLFANSCPFAAIASGNGLERVYRIATGGRIATIDFAEVIATKLTEVIEEIKQ